MVDLIIVIGYFITMLVVGWLSRHQTAESYWVAERRYTTGRITMSLAATIFGASSTMGIIGLGYARGMTGAWWSLVGGVALIPFGLILASRVRALEVYTLPDILKKSYGDRVAVPAGLMIAMAWCGVIAAQLVAAGRLVTHLFPIGTEGALVLVAVVFTLYTFWGGQLSVIRTDFWQLFLFGGGLLVSLLILIGATQGDAEAWSRIPRAHFQFPVSTDFGWYDLLVFYPLIVGMPYLVGPDIYSRILCARDDRVARRAALGAALLVIPLSFLLALMGLLARATFPGIPAESALPQTLDVLVPVGVKGVIVAGFLGAIMSSADTCLISAATIVTLNVLGPLTRSGSGQHRLTRIMVLVLGGIAWYVASRQQGIISSLLLGYTVFVGGVVLPTLGAFAGKRLRLAPNGAFWAIVVGGGSAILGKLEGGVMMTAMLGSGGQALLSGLLGPRYLSILPVILSGTVLLGVSWMSRRR